MSLTVDPRQAFAFSKGAMNRLIGVDPKDVDLQVESRALTIKGRRHFENEGNGKASHRIPRSYGSLS